MQYDLSFWNLPDWERESSIDPKFLAGIAAALLLLLMLATFSWSLRGLQSRRVELGTVTAQNRKVIDKAAEVQRQMACTRRWEELLGQLDSKGRTRVVWCRQLASLTGLVPDSMVLHEVTLRSQRAEAVADKGPAPAVAPAAPAAPAAGSTSSAAAAPARRPAPTKTTKIQVIQCELTIKGVVRGADASEQINTFSRSLERHAELGALLDFAKLKNVAPEAGGDEKAPGKQFTIQCRFKPIRWFDEPAPKKVQ